MVLDILNATDVVNKTACVSILFWKVKVCMFVDNTRREFARVFGVDFYSVITRGSQFKVESFMFRIAKPESFVLLSPSKSDVSSFLPSTLTDRGIVHVGWQTKRGGMHASHNGAAIGIL